MGEAHRKKTAIKTAGNMSHREVTAFTKGMANGEVITIRLELPTHFENDQAALQKLITDLSQGMAGDMAKLTGQADVKLAYAITFSPNLAANEVRVGSDRIVN